MVNVLMSPERVAIEVGRGWDAAYGHRRRPKLLAEPAGEGVVSLVRQLAICYDPDEMERRARRVGRQLADEAMRRRVRWVCVPTGKPLSGYWTVKSESMQVGLRLTMAAWPGLQQAVYQVDMLAGGRTHG